MSHEHTQPAQTAVPKPTRLASIAVPFVLLLTVGAAVAAVVILGLIPQQKAREDLEARTKDNVAARPRVTVAKATQAPADLVVTLPARLEALQESSIYPQVGGYLTQIKVDIGDAVKAGDLLAQINTPVLDEQVLVNQSNLLVSQGRVGEADARVALSKTTLNRLTEMSDPRAVSQQAIDDASGKLAIDTAAAVSARAELESVRAEGNRLAQQKSLSRILAPFDGEISQRGYDLGALVVADKVDGARPLFHIADRIVIRAFIDAPQSAATLVHTGQVVNLSIREIAARTFTGEIKRLSSSMDSTTRTRLLEVHLGNSDHALLPGMFAQATLILPRSPRPVLVPAEALIARPDGLKVAVVDDQNKLHYRPIKLGRDTGSTLEVLEGLAEGESVALNLAKTLDDGTVVEPVQQATPTKK